MFKIKKLEKSAVTTADSGSPYSSRRLFIFDPITQTKFLIDTGADVSVIPASFTKYEKHKPDHIITAANGSNINVFGTKLLKLSIGLRREFYHPFLVASVGKPIIGADFLNKYGLIVDIRNRRIYDPVTKISSIGSITVGKTEIPKHYVVDNDFGRIIQDFPELLREPDFTKPVQHNVVHQIDTNGKLPTARSRRLTAKKLEAAKAEFEYMVSIGVCRISL